MKFSEIFIGMTLAAMLLFAQTSRADDFICSYHARISAQDKINSYGRSVISGYNQSSVAAVLRQDRANYHAFGRRDFDDESDCMFSDKNHRARFEQYLNRGTLSRSAMRAIINGNPMIKVSIYTNHVEVDVLHNSSGRSGYGSSIR